MNEDEFTYDPCDPPFQRWWGPYTPSTGKRYGIRVRQDGVGIYADAGPYSTFWRLCGSPGAWSLSEQVRWHFGGGRVLLLPSGHVVKPLQTEAERGVRVVIGQWGGTVILRSPDGQCVDLSDASELRPGDQWIGPCRLGLTCILRPDGSLDCEWYHPEDTGRLDVLELLRGPDSTLADGFRRARPGHLAGRVRVTTNGIVLANRQIGGPWSHVWEPSFVGVIDPEQWPFKEEWIGEPV